MARVATQVMRWGRVLDDGTGVADLVGDMMEDLVGLNGLSSGLTT
jgi:hypothetical protein